ncbi:MAG: hypothetical protein NUV50_10115 [Rhodospirillales bacterium]|nr:hypothetical protein [Rhodospirillales bacterium]
MSVSIEFILAQGDAPVHRGVTILGVTDEARQNVQVYYEIPLNGVQSANLRAVSDDLGRWAVAFPGDFTTGTEVTAFARNGSAELAWLTKVL